MTHGTPAPSKATTVHRPALPGARRATQPSASASRSLDQPGPKGHRGQRRTADAEARRLLEAHAREFPRGQLAAEREALLRQLR